MAYEIGLVAHHFLGLPVKVVTVGKERAKASVFDYPVLFDTVTARALPDLVAPHDLLICNPSFSDGRIGLTHRCRKLMYVQGFTTFSILDRWFDRYVAVSGFVRHFLQQVYDVSADVISPFVTPPTHPVIPWQERRVDSILLYAKGNGDLHRLLLDRLKTEVAGISPQIAARVDWEGSLRQAGGLAQSELFADLAKSRYLLSLSVGEGFGLVPLEAMAAGTTVLGFDGFGGRDYMRPSENCAVRPYPNIADLARDLVTAFERPAWAAQLAARGQATAADYSKAQFHSAWRPVLESMI
ncbi:glycosyltransferase [Roseixanthobacter glucoisosaccharinicivorans]|uniref:glycosyltransferase n=1 Tax=Roseixanthobacter glucoisosaccharinicivorans TaxID=3119923 RepID=UPI0037281F9E